MSTDYNGSAYTDQNPAAKVLAWEVLPSNLAALQATSESTTFLVPPGFTRYGAGADAAIPTWLAEDLVYGGPGWALGDGTITDGAYSAGLDFYVLCDLAQAYNESGGLGSPIQFYALPTGELSCAGYRLFFCSEAFTMD